MSKSGSNGTIIAKLVNLPQMWLWSWLENPINRQLSDMDSLKSPKSLPKLAPPENALKPYYRWVNLGQMGLKVTKKVNFSQMWLWSWLKNPINWQRSDLDIPKSPKSLHKLAPPENLLKPWFWWVNLGQMGLKIGKLVNLAQRWLWSWLKNPINR